jgi:rod shape determining protein RodA
MERHRRPDWLLMLLPILIFMVGLFFVHSASRTAGGGWDSSLAIKQFCWMLIGIGVMLVTVKFPYRFLQDWAWPLYGSVLFLLVLVLFMPSRLGARRWIDLGFFSLQPSELAKVAVIIALAYLLKSRNIAREGLSAAFLPAVATFVPMLLILKEPDLGTGLLLVPVLLAMLYVSAFRMRWILTLFGIAAAAAPFLYNHLKDYQKLRILNFLNPDRDPLGSGYNIIQSKIAIGSGGFWGKGLLEGSQTQLRFLPERHTDFIFSVIGEEGGFIACAFVLIALAIIMHRGYRIAQDCPGRFGRLLAVGITTLLASQAIINISMTMGLVPVVGMPLFFVSYGGSSIVAKMFLVGILVNIGMHRDSAV